MAGLALIAREAGFEVSGCDQAVYPPMSNLLRTEGIAIQEGYHPASLTVPPGLCVIGNALSRGNPEIEALLRDVSERRKLEDQGRDVYHQLLQAEKLAALGQTVSGVAHELNNPLATIRQGLFGILRDEGVGLGPQRGSQHSARPVARNLGQRIIHRFRLTKGDDVCSLLHGVSFLLEVLAGFDTSHDTPPSQTPSPISRHSSISDLAELSLKADRLQDRVAKFGTQYALDQMSVLRR